MTDPQSELVAATRLLVQWGRARQATWHDPSRDLLAALGDRHATFSDFSPHDADTPPPVPVDLAIAPPAPIATSPAPVPRTAEAPSVEASSAPPLAMVASEPPVSARPLAPPPPVTPVRPTSIGSTTGLRRIGRAPLVVAAAVVLLALAAPSVWRTYQPSAPAAPVQNRVAIDSKPPGSVVVINGVEKGKTPLVTELPAGVYRVELRYRKNVRAFDLEVVTGMPAEASVDWTKKPVIKKKAAPEKGAGTKTAMATAKAAASGKAEPESPAVPERPSPAAVLPDADAAPAEPPATPAEPTDGL